VSVVTPSIPAGRETLHRTARAITVGAEKNPPLHNGLLRCFIQTPLSLRALCPFSNPTYCPDRSSPAVLCMVFKRGFCCGWIQDERERERDRERQSGG
jgi:hypothetical protein